MCRADWIAIALYTAAVIGAVIPGLDYGCARPNVAHRKVAGRYLSG
jgi:hypothetical protein